MDAKHAQQLRKFADFELGSFILTNKIVLNIDGKKAWIFHGDVFDVVMQHGKWLARLGAVGYDMLILINRFVNYLSAKMGRGKISLSKKIKNTVNFFELAFNTCNSFEGKKPYQHNYISRGSKGSWEYADSFVGTTQP